MEAHFAQLHDDDLKMHIPPAEQGRIASQGKERQSDVFLA